MIIYNGIFSMKKTEYFIAVLLSVISFISVGVIELSYSQSSIVFFGVSWFLGLFFMLYIGNRNPIASVYSISFFLYYYQVPFLEYNAAKSEGIYRFTVIESILSEYYFIYSFLLFINMFIVFYLSNRFNKAHNNVFEFSPNIKRVILPSFFVTSGLLFYTITKLGGFSQFLALNKFESVTEGQILFFTWKDFSIIFMVSVFFSKLSKVERVIYHSLILFFVFVEILTAKRLLMLFYFIYVYLVYFGKINLTRSLLVIIVLLFSNFIKYTYYSLKQVFQGYIELKEIFWFDWKDFFMDSILIGEFSAHLHLTYLNMFYQVPYDKSYFLQFIFSILPFSSNLDINYLTAGEKLRLFLAEPWSGLASGIYITPYFSFFIWGLIIVYIIYISFFNILFILSNKSNLFKLLFLCLLPFLTFYIQREELIVLFKRFYVLLPLCLLFYVFMMRFKK